MPTPKPPHPAAFRQRMVELVRAGRSVSDLAREFGCNASSIHAWVKAAGGLDGSGTSSDNTPLSMNERQELIELRRRFKQVQAELPVRAMCKKLRVSHSGFYDWLERPACAQAQANAVLLEQIRQAHAASDATNGVPRIRAELAYQGIKAGHSRIAAVMRANGVRGVSRRRGWCVTTKRDKEQRPAPDLVQREFTATGINQLWVAYMTYIPTWAGFVYLAVVLDVHSRKVVGWAFGQQQTADLVISALYMALITRKAQGVFHHSDQGSQGEFNQSLQHILNGGVDEAEEVEIGAIAEGQVTVAGQAAGAASRSARAVLERNRARSYQRGLRPAG